MEWSTIPGRVQRVGTRSVGYDPRRRELIIKDGMTVEVIPTYMIPLNAKLADIVENPRRYTWDLSRRVDVQKLVNAHIATRKEILASLSF